MDSNQTLAMSNRRDAHMQESSSCTESDVLTNSKIPPPSQKVILVASGMDDEMESHAINLAIEAISIFPGEKMKIAKYIANAFEANYASLWHCIVSDGHMRFYVRYDADNHIYFAIGQLSIFLFRLHRSKPRVVLARLVAQRRMSDVFVKIDSPRDDVRVMSSGMQLHMQHYAIRITDDAINEFPNEKMIIAHRITTRFELKYGGNWHCVVSDASLGYEVRHDREDHMFFSVGHLTVLIFREMDLPPITTAIQQPPKRKISTSMQFPTRIISSGMNMESQQFAVNVAVKGILMKENKNESSHLAEFLVSHFDERFGPHWYCFTADRPLAFYTHYDPNNYIHLRVDLYTFLLFKVAPSQLSIHANVKSSRNEAVTPLDGNTIVVDLIERNSKRTQIMASDMPESMKERAEVLAAEAVKRFPDERMLCAHFIMTRFEAEFGPPCHCVISDTKIEYGFHECNHYYCYFLIDSLYIFLFQNDVSSD